jgi:hypothetical protein
LKISLFEEVRNYSGLPDHCCESYAAVLINPSDCTVETGVEGEVFKVTPGVKTP